MISQRLNQAHEDRKTGGLKTMLRRVALALVTASAWWTTAADASEMSSPPPVTPNTNRLQSGIHPRPGYSSDGKESKVANLPVSRIVPVDNWDGPQPSFIIDDDGAVYSITGPGRTLLGKAGLIHKKLPQREAYWVFDDVTKRAPASFDGLAFGFKQTRVTDKPEPSKPRKRSFRPQP